MGSSIKHSNFSDEDYEAFSHRLQKNLKTLAKLLDQPGFGVGDASLGAELELSLIDQSGSSKWINQLLIDQARDPQLTLELNRYNLECNLSPLPAAGAPFSKIADEITNKIRGLNQLAANYQARTVAIGILPTLEEKDIGVDAMSDYIRYRVLTESIKAMRGSPFKININGADPLQMTLSNLNAEGANTSFQIHLRINPDQFANCYNAAQMATAPCLAISTNSPLFLGHQLWEETRIPLFKQAVETRNNTEIAIHRTARTGLGSGWIQESALELFQRSVDDFDVLLPEHLDQEQAGSAPELFELKLHHGTIWHWNRAIYDHTCGGHLRIEMRALPSGPSALDMAANAAFLVGLSMALRHQMEDYIKRINFNDVKTSFYRAAELGLDAPILWPDKKGKATHILAHQLIEELLPMARTGLQELAIDTAEIDLMLSVIAQRLEKRITGARWQLQRLHQLEKQMPRPEALKALLRDYLTHSDSGAPVSQWSIQ